MKKKLLSALLCLVLALTLLPTAALAAPTRLKSVDLVIDLPKAGDPNEMETEVTIKSMKSGNIDLLANGAGILYTEWQGDDVETDDGYAFRAGTTYLVNIKLAFDTTKGYCANYKTVGGENIVGPDTFSATVNGVPATIRTSAQYFPTLQVSLTLEGERYTEAEKEELNADLTRKTDLLRQAKRAMATPRTQAVAESKQLENFVNGVTVMTDANHVLENTDSIRTLILDTNGKITDGTCFFICYAKYLKELWLSDKVDVYQFIQAMDSYLWLPIAGLYRWERQSDLPFYTAETVAIPNSGTTDIVVGIGAKTYTLTILRNSGTGGNEGGGGGSSSPSYSITVDKTKNGTITVSPRNASHGDTVTITATPDKGYELEMLKVLDRSGDALKLTEKNGKYTFKMPSGKVTIKASFVEEVPEQIFKDVPANAYYYEAVKWAQEKGITGGIGNGLFGPNDPCTRAQIVTFLWRAAGQKPRRRLPSRPCIHRRPGVAERRALLHQQRSPALRPIREDGGRGLRLSALSV